MVKMIIVIMRDDQIVDSVRHVFGLVDVGTGKSLSDEPDRRERNEDRIHEDALSSRCPFGLRPKQGWLKITGTITAVAIRRNIAKYIFLCLII